MPRRRKLTFLELVKLCKDNGIEEAEADGMKVKMLPREVESVLPETVSFPDDFRSESMANLLHSTDMTDDEIKEMMK